MNALLRYLYTAYYTHGLQIASLQAELAAARSERSQLEFLLEQQRSDVKRHEDTIIHKDTMLGGLEERLAALKQRCEGITSDLLAAEKAASLKSVIVSEHEAELLQLRTELTNSRDVLLQTQVMLPVSPHFSCLSSCQLVPVIDYLVVLYMCTYRYRAQSCDVMAAIFHNFISC